MSDSATRRPAIWWGLVLAAIGIGICTTAGVWQLGRASQKGELQTQFAAGGSTSALQQLVPDPEAAPLRYHTLQLTGRYDPDHQVMLDNMSYAGRPGYHVLTPLATASGTVLVNRGWVPANGDRAIFPDLQVGNALREVRGRIEQLPQPGIALASITPPRDAPWPRRLLFPTSAEISAQFGSPLRDYQLLLDPGAVDGFVRDWHPGGMPPERHLAYAVQWFGLALTVAIVYVVLIFRNRKRAQ